jgi:hypothetical protein
MTTAELCDTLDEAARYVRTAPDEAVRLADAAIEEMMSRRATAAETDGFDHGWSRLITNIMSGIRYRQVEPDVFSGYLRAAKFEIQAASTEDER